MADEIRSINERHADAIHVVGGTKAPEDYLSAMDIYCLPSFREGSAVTPLEAAASGLPCLLSRIYGLEGSLVEGETGFSHEPGDAAALAELMVRLAGDAELRASMGEQGRLRTQRSFSAATVTQAWVDFYDALLVG